MLNNATINGIPCLVAESRRIKKDDAPVRYPHTYQGCHSSNDWSIPISINNFVAVNFWGTIFASEPLLEKGFDHVNISSIEYNGMSIDSMQNVCPDCSSWLDYGSVVVTGNTLYAAVACTCGFKGREEYSLSNYTAWVADETYEGENPDGSIVCPSCHSAVTLPTHARFDDTSVDLEMECPFCGASVEASISCYFEGNIALPMPA